MEMVCENIMRGSFNKFRSNGKLFLAEDERKFAKFDTNM
jgi:hypothetical protein